MKINIASIVKLPGGKVRFEGTGSAKTLGLRKDCFESVENLSVVAEAVNVTEGVIEVSGSIETVILMQCSRCLEDISLPFEIDFVESFSTQEDPQTDVYGFSGDFIDLSDALSDNIIANMPMRAVCSVDCQGLCPVCGINKNTTRCKCQEEFVDPRLLALKTLIDDEEV